MIAAALGVFLATAAADVCWTLYFIKTSERAALPAAMWSCAIVACGVVTTLGYVHDIRLAGAAMLGAFCGTYLTVLLNR